MAEYRYSLRGEIDLANASDLRADLGQIIRGTGSHVVLDCSELTFIDSTGVCVILEARRELHFQDRHMRIVNVSDPPRRVFEMLGLADLIRRDQIAS